MLWSKPPGQIPLKLPNVKFDFDVSVGSIQLLTDTLKLNLTLGSKLWVLIIACKWVCYIYDGSVSVDSMQYITHSSKTLHQSRIPRSVLSVVCVHDFHWIGNESTTKVLTSQKVVAQKFFIVELINSDFFLCATATFSEPPPEEQISRKWHFQFRLNQSSKSAESPHLSQLSPTKNLKVILKKKTAVK